MLDKRHFLSLSLFLKRINICVLMFLCVPYSAYIESIQFIVRSRISQDTVIKKRSLHVETEVTVMN